MHSHIRKARGRWLEVDIPTDAERAFIFSTLQDPLVHVPLGCRYAPLRKHFDAGILELQRGDEKRHQAVVYYILRPKSGLNDEPQGPPLGYFLSYGWDYPHDSVRELDLVFPHKSERNIGYFHDASVIIAHFLFRNRLLKRMRWRVDVTEGRAKKRLNRQGGRLLREFEERHPVTGEWRRMCIFELARADYVQVLNRLGASEDVEYGDIDASLWSLLRSP